MTAPASSPVELPAALHANGVRVERGSKALLDDITLTLSAGSMTVLLGPNGAGKTTLIRVLAGIVPPTKGSILLGTAPLQSLSRSAIARKCAYLPQQMGTDFEICVEDAVALGRYAHIGSWAAMRRIDYELVNWAIERVGLTSLRQRTIPTLSGGERQRAFIARALAQEAPILLLDEPIAALDIGRQIDLMGLLKELNAEGRTVLAALHDLRPALDFFPDALLLDAGRLTAQGPTSEVIQGQPLAAAFGVKVRRAEQICFDSIERP
ncbi:MAG TPA: ABC transporter ATP-binding protein [Pirellulales bacterium]|nr:ABC transporter ATP-binding protein [Pirellulales bacterium]